MKLYALAREEKVRRFPFWYIESVEFPNGRVLGSNCEMCEALRVHFRDRFARCPGLLVQEFCCYLADFPRLREAEAVGCEDLVTECEVRDALKQIGLNKSPGLDGIPYKVYLRLNIFLRIYSTTGLPREPSLVALPSAWSHCWRKVAGIFWRTLMITGP